MNSWPWCTHSELKALSDYTKHAKVHQKYYKGPFTENDVLPECHGERLCQMLYWLVVTTSITYIAR